LGACLGASVSLAQTGPVLPIKPDLIVAADGSGDFKTVEAAVASIPKDNHERKVIFIKDGVYHEKVRIDANDVTLLGQSRARTRLEFAQSATEARTARDGLGSGVVNVNGDDCVLQNLTIQNTHGVIGVHAFAIYGKGDRTVITDANVWSQGNDTLSLWRQSSAQYGGDAAGHSSADGRYYHARLDVCGSVDFICPRGTCYMVDSNIHEVKAQTEAVWHDGSRGRDMKFVLRDCHFDGPQDWRLARHHHDGQFYFIDCLFAATMLDRQPKRVLYPLNGGTSSADDIRNNREHDPTNIWGERAYYYETHRDGGDYAWMRENLETAPGAPKPGEITGRGAGRPDHRHFPGERHGEGPAPAGPALGRLRGLCLGQRRQGARLRGPFRGRRGGEARFCARRHRRDGGRRHAASGQSRAALRAATRF
jgi:pectinesterase